MSNPLDACNHKIADEHAHLDEATKQRMRLAACPIHSKHDHADKRAFGFDRDRQPVPAWWFNCPRCGTSESKVHLESMTSSGIAWLREHDGTKGTWYAPAEPDPTTEPEPELEPVGATSCP